ncbi:MAG: HAD family hydrolase [Bacillota bacterium]
MIEIKIPGMDIMKLNHIVLDFNGTMATDGIIIPGVIERLNSLSRELSVHILTADTFGTVREACSSVNGTVTVLSQGAGASEKEAFVRRLGEQSVVAVGNGMNDRMMLRTSALGILVIGAEGSSAHALAAADIVTGSINDALDLLLNTKRVIATLRS